MTNSFGFFATKDAKNAKVQKYEMPHAKERVLEVKPITRLESSSNSTFVPFVSFVHVKNGCDTGIPANVTIV